MGHTLTAQELEQARGQSALLADQLRGADERESKLRKTLEQV
jgi:hypothetical protein